MTLVYAFESNYWRSEKCFNNFNCFGIKKTSYNTWIKYKLDNNNFKIYKNYNEWNLDFARLYIRFHLNKNINEFIKSWSMTDRQVYIWFMKEKYWSIYNYFILLYR
jgi:hypothetical protein